MSTIAAPPSLVPGEYRIVKNAEGRWKVIDPNESDPFPDQEFETILKAVEAILLSGKDEHFTYQFPQGDPNSMVTFMISDTRSEVEIRATVTLEMKLFLDSFARQVEITWDEAVQQAIRFLKIAADANRAGKLVAIIDDKEGTEEEITGILDKNDVQ